MGDTSEAIQHEWDEIDVLCAGDIPLVLLGKQAKRGANSTDLKAFFGGDAPKTYLQRPLTEAEARRARTEGYNLGSKCGDGFCVLDFDERHFPPEVLARGESGLAEYYAEVMTTLGLTGEDYPIVISGSQRGQHIYVKVQSDANLRASIKGFPGVDVKNGGHVVTPGSIHPDTGELYRFENGPAYTDLNDMLIAGSDFYRALSKDIECLTPNNDHPRSQPAVSLEMLKKILDHIDPEALSYADWFAVFSGAIHAAGEDGYWVIDEWNERDPERYDREANQKTLESILRHNQSGKKGYTIATLLYFAKMYSQEDTSALCRELGSLTAGVKLGIASKTRRIKAWEDNPSDLLLDEDQQNLPQKSLFERFNEKFALVTVGKDVMVMELDEDERFQRFLRPSAFSVMHGNKFVNVNGKMKAAGEAWLRWPGRRTYKDVKFAPGVDLPSNEFNLFPGWQVKPNPNASCDLFLDHVCNLICGGVESWSEYVLDYCADIIQNTKKKPGVAIVLAGEKGMGKDTFAEYLSRIIGPKFCPVLSRSEQITGRFNAQLGTAILARLEEGVWAGNRQQEGILKSLITAPLMTIERKGLDAIQQSSSLRLFISSNNDWVIPASGHERRYVAFDVGSEVPDAAYFDALYEEMNGEGPAALLNFLMERDLSNFDIRKPPKTPALIKQKIEGLRNVERYIFELLASGQFPSHQDGDWETGQVTVPAAYFRDCYATRIETARKQNDHRFEAVSAQTFAKSLSAICPDHYKNRPRVDGKPGMRMYVFPELARCRQLAERYLGYSIPWEAMT